MSPWVWLIIASVLEIGWAVGLKVSDGLTKRLPAALTIAAMIASFVCLAKAVRTLPIGTGYAVWTGIGAAGTAIFGMIYFHESVDPRRLLALALIVAGVVLLKLVGK